MGSPAPLLGLIGALLLVTASASAQQRPAKSGKQHERCAGVVAQVAGAVECLQPRGTFRDCPACPEMVVVPPGSFAMGSDHSSDEQPIHRVVIARAFAVGRTEVTFAEWDACADDGGCAHKPDDNGWGRGTRPVIGVSWDDATAEYLPWLSRKSGQRYRLLTEAEWEYAARARSTGDFISGSDIARGSANCDGCGSRWDNKQTAPTASFPPNAFGLHDMHGNVWEWTQDCYADSYKGAPTNGAARTAPACTSRVVRGGGWSDKPRYLRSAVRYGDPPIYRGTYVGFRVARAL